MMDERSLSTPPAEAPLQGGHGRQPGSGPADAHEPAGALDDPRALAILTTEHWSLLSARSLVYNEAFARGGMFLAFLSATLVALGLVATATGFSDGFLMVAAVLLGLNLFVGFASLGRIAAASNEDIRYLQGMNRIRHAYHEMVPGLEPYFISGHHDDIDSVLSFYGPAQSGTLRNIVHGLTTTPGMLGVICSAVGGVLAAVIVMLQTHNPQTAGITGLVASIGLFVLLSGVVMASIFRAMRRIESIFPRDRTSER
jgi:hypothetical protein